MSESEGVRDGAVRDGFTPGPWFIDPHPNPGFGFGIVGGGDEVCSGANEADARLIAAAPDLLALVEDWMVLMQPGREPTSADYIAHYDRCFKVQRKAHGISTDAPTTKAS